MTTSRGLGAAAVIAVLLLGGASHARPCETMSRHASLRGLGEEIRFAAAARPESAGHLDSSLWPIRVHYETEGLATRAPSLLGIAEAGWQLLVEEIGYPRPVPDGLAGGDDRLDLYLAFVGVAGALTIAEEGVNTGAGFSTAPAYIIVSPELSDDELPTFVHHELAHAAQFAMDLDESLMFFEASAVAHERYALPGVLRWAESLDDFQAWPSAPVFTNGIDWRQVTGRATLYEFGAALFLLYLEQEHGSDDGRLIRDLWLASRQPAGEGNEPDWLDALPGLTGNDLASLVLDFASWRTLVAGWTVPGISLPEATAFSGDTLPSTLRLAPSALDGEPIALSRERLPHQYGCAAVETVTGGDAISVHVEARALPRTGAEPRPLGLAYVIGDPLAASASRGAMSSPEGFLETSLELPARQTLVLYLCDVGDADADDLPVATELELRVSPIRPDAEVPDVPDDVAADGGSADDLGAVPATCGCQQGSPPSSPSGRGKPAPGPFAALRPYAGVAMTSVFLLVFLRRLIGVSRRRRLYKADRERREPTGPRGA